MIIDTHAHIYSSDEQNYPPISDPYMPPTGTGDTSHLRDEMAKAGVDRAVLIQTSTFYRWDNRYLRDTAALSTDWATGVCTLDPDNPQSPDMLYALYDRSNVKGMRSIQAADGSYDGPGVRRLWKEASELGIVINSLIPLEVSDQLENLLGDFPNLSVVLDHCLSLKYGEDYDATVSKVLDLAQYPNVYAKLTFIPTGSAELFPFRDMHDACKRFIDAYSPDRCIWCSDFTLELWAPKVTYNDHLRIFQEDLGLNTEEQTAILGGTAECLWFK